MHFHYVAKPPPPTNHPLLTLFSDSNMRGHPGCWILKCYANEMLPSNVRSNTQRWRYAPLDSLVFGMHKLENRGSNSDCIDSFGTQLHSAYCGHKTNVRGTRCDCDCQQQYDTIELRTLVFPLSALFCCIFCLILPVCSSRQILILVEVAYLLYHGHSTSYRNISHVSDSS